MIIPSGHRVEANDFIVAVPYVEHIGLQPQTIRPKSEYAVEADGVVGISFHASGRHVDLHAVARTCPDEVVRQTDDGVLDGDAGATRMEWGIGQLIVP